MPGGSSDPRLFFSLDNVRAFHVQDGEETELTPSGPQTLSLLMVPTTIPVVDPANPHAVSGNTEEDFYLHLHLPPELELPLPATTQVYHQPPDSYLIPRWDLGPEAGAFTRIQFPKIGSGPGMVSQEDVDTFETILAQCTAFLERSPPPKHHGKQPQKQQQGGYNPATYAPGEGYAGTGDEKNGQIVLVDEENGSVVGELTEGFNVVQSTDVKPGSKDPVQIQLPETGNQITVSNAPPEYLRMASHPAYAKSSLVQGSAMASRLLVTTSEALASLVNTGADSFTRSTKPAAKPMTFSPSAQAHIRKINTFSQSAAGLSAKTVGQLGKYAQNLGAALTRRGERDPHNRGYDINGKPIPDYKPGILNKSMIAISTLGDGLDHSARHLLSTGSQAASKVMGHRYGEEARAVTTDITGGVKNVGLVYIDAMGVSRRAILKSVAKGMVVGRMKDGQQLVVGGGDGGQIGSSSVLSPPSGKLESGLSAQFGASSSSSSSGPMYRAQSPAPPPAYGAQGGKSLGGTPMNDSHKYQ
ncbi:hypothetical protein H109_06818 [Trichophyton interdigitale MR816]|uniref:Senescence domain-containing protein n=1 Tax=Trichophyton interdigitale (strain MR816) TaxID=1215338 RepID=A0A059J0G7_TRIIM|nr:hypothetical protein H101_02363 [Trichophyton interdigitale H6]KDB21249.1 hypothetical protein H109_06818 [Trichophyton interdigitale MR816]